MRTLAAIASLSLLLTAAPLACAGELYKWVDEKGVTNYGDAPPAKTARKVVPLDETKSSLSVVPGLTKEEVAGMEARAERARNSRLAQENDELRARLAAAATPAPAPVPVRVEESAPVYVAPIIVRRPAADPRRPAPRPKTHDKTVPPPGAMRADTR